jgi:hypothetical protein
VLLRTSRLPLLLGTKYRYVILLLAFKLGSLIRALVGYLTSRHFLWVLSRLLGRQFGSGLGRLLRWSQCGTTC